jgi:hypothetical protein
MIPMTDPTPALSPSAQAVRDAVLALYQEGPVRDMAWQLEFRTVVATIRSLVEQTVPEEPYCHEDDPVIEYTLRNQRQLIRINQLSIANELEQEATNMLLSIATELENH